MAKFTSIDLSAHFITSKVSGAAAWHPDIGEALKTPIRSADLLGHPLCPGRGGGGRALAGPRPGARGGRACGAGALRGRGALL